MRKLKFGQVKDLDKNWALKVSRIESRSSEIKTSVPQHKTGFRGIHVSESAGEEYEVEYQNFRTEMDLVDH